MASRLFQIVRKELVSPLVEQPKVARFASSSSSSSSSPSSSGSSGSSSSKAPGLTQNEKRIQTALKVLAVFLPGVYIGHVITDQGIVDELKEDSEKDEDSKKEEGGKDDHGKKF